MVTEQPETPNKEVDVETVAYQTGRRDALHSFYIVVMGRPNLLREEMIELLRLATLDAERKLRAIPKAQGPRPEIAIKTRHIMRRGLYPQGTMA